MNNRSLCFNLIALVLGMVMLTYASVPLYRLFCQVTGFGGTTKKAISPAPGAVGTEMTIRFNADTDSGLPWRFAPEQKDMRVRVGEQSLAFYTAENLTDKPVKGHAVYNVTPTIAGAYFAKIECFCFTEQTLAARQKVNMPVSFYIDPAILTDPETKKLRTITLSYTFFPVKPADAN